jgi:2-furoyl-CoA dehydrogenase large subunit
MEMKFNGEFRVSQPRKAVFDLLADPEKFAPLLPTFQSLEMKDERTATVRVKVGIGRIRGTASTELTLEESKAPTSARYVGRGKLMQGAYEMSAAFDLAEAGGGTQVRWTGEARLHGKILSLAGGGLRGYAEKEIGRVIGSLQRALSPQAVTAAAPPAEGWFARALRTLRRGGDGRGAVEPPTEVTAEGLAPAPKEALEARERALARISKVLAAKRQPAKLARKEDDRLVRGCGLFVDDYRPAGMLHMAVVRSPYAHARILNVDVSKAEALPGVACTLTGKEITALSDPFMQIGPEPSARIKDYCLAVDKVRYQGDPVAAVVARTPRLAFDAAQLVEVGYEVLPVVVNCDQALEDKVLIHEQVGTNRIWHGVFEYGDVEKAFEEAARVVRIERLNFHRFGSTPLETNACVATWDPRGNIDLFVNTIMTIAMAMIAPALRVSMESIRMWTHDIGGGFGNKIGNYPYVTLAALASRKCGGAPVKWVETRSEHMQTGGQGSERNYFDTEVALDADGVITAIRSRHVDDCGGYPRYEPLGCVIWSQVLPGPYKLRNMRIDFNQVVTNKGPCSPNRGYSRLQHLWFMDRVLDICGHELGIPADQMRLRNYIPEFPYETPNGCVYDSGDFAGMLAKAKGLIGWDEWKRRQAQARQEGRRIGIGIGTAIDSGTNNFGQARIVNPYAPFSGNSEVSICKLELDGTVSVTLGTFPQGQGHETTAAQTVAADLGIDPDMVRVKTGFDSARNSHTGVSGTYASQFAVTGLSAAHGAAIRLKAEMKKLAAFALEANEDDLEFGVGKQGPEVRVVGTDRAVNYWALSNMINYNNATLPEELRELTLNCRYVYVPPFKVPDIERKFGNITLTYAMQVHIAVVEVDPQTYQSKILDYAVVDDCGRVVNHMIVRGQVEGGAAHGIGAAILEECPYDEDGNLLTGSFTDYAPITISNMPDLRYDHMESPSPFSFNGAKGMGEGGGTPLPALSAALQDALFGDGIIIRNSHNSPMALHRSRPQLDRAKAVTVVR